ncbi:MAG: hypothetical protein Kow0031_22140 [Anaerolineae bacterium]
MDLLPGHTIQLNRRLWTLRHVAAPQPGRLRLEAIGASEAALGMTRQMEALQLGPRLFIEQRRGGYWQANLLTGWQDGPAGPVLNFQPATPLDLLDAHTQAPGTGDLTNSFSWSFSRAALYRRCPRAYYYHYYAAWNGWQPDAPPPVRRAYLLKNLTTIPQWVGTLLHDAIKYALNRLQSGATVPPAELLAQMRQRARADVEASRQQMFRQQPKQRPGFQEHYYRANLSAADWAAAWQRAEQRLRTFVESPLYARLQGLPPDAFLRVETLQSFEQAGEKVWVQMDLATVESGQLALYDWKTGEVDPDEGRRQLGVYGLFVRRNWPEFGAMPLRGILFGLAENRVATLDLHDDLLRQTEQAIERSIVRLRGLLDDPAANRAGLSRFPMTDDREVCATCRFRELCNRAG